MFDNGMENSLDKVLKIRNSDINIVGLVTQVSHLIIWNRHPDQSGFFSCYHDQQGEWKAGFKNS
jgi:hypothetical protein